MSDEPRGRTLSLREVPVGLEKVLYTAAIDPGFREELLRDREAAVLSRGLALEGSELAMLRLAPEAQLAAAIAALDTSETNLARRGFMRAVAGAVTLAAGSVLSGCGEEATRGIQPDMPRFHESGGIRPDDLGLDAPRVHADAGSTRDISYLESPPAPAGIRPDDIGLPEAAKKPDAK